MGFIILFIYFNYLLKTGYHVTVLDWVVLFVVGALQLISWFIRTGVLTSYIKPDDSNKEVKRIDEWFRE